MVPHKRPSRPFVYDWRAEVAALRAYRDNKPGRKIPAKQADRALAATWNLTNFGVQKRRRSDIRVMAEIISWFDIVAVQEVADDLSHLDILMRYLPGYDAVITDPGGNAERLGFIYDRRKAKRRELSAEVAVPPAQHRYIRFPTVSGEFKGFDRNPFVTAFTIGALNLTFVSVHLYYGGKDWKAIDRRTLETFAVARWANARRRSDSRYAKNIAVLGDFNLPKRAPTDKVYRALISRGLVLPNHSTKMGSNLAGDQDYDQVAFFPGNLSQRMLAAGVYDFDGAVFKDAWETRPGDFQAIVKYYLADHRPLWVQFDAS